MQHITASKTDCISHQQGAGQRRDGREETQVHQDNKETADERASQVDREAMRKNKAQTNDK